MGRVSVPASRNQNFSVVIKRKGNCAIIFIEHSYHVRRPWAKRCATLYCLFANITMQIAYLVVQYLQIRYRAIRMQMKLYHHFTLTIRPQRFAVQQVKPSILNGLDECGIILIKRRIPLWLVYCDLWHRSRILCGATSEQAGTNQYGNKTYKFLVHD